jgi:chromobox protein 1
VKKSKSTTSLRQQSFAEDSPAPKKRKIQDDESWRPPRQDWEPDVDRIDTIERDKTGNLMVFVLFNNGKKLKVSMDQVYKHCPRPMLRFYEKHLHFKSVEEIESKP